MSEFNFNPSPVALKRFSVDNFNNNKIFSGVKNALNIKTIFGIDNLKRVSRQTTLLLLSIILSTILHTLISSTEIYDEFINNFDPPSIKIGRIKIKTRKLLNQLVKYIFVIGFFIMINLLIPV